MAGLHFDITGDNSNFLRKLEESRNGVHSTSRQIEDSGMSIEQMFGRMTTAAATFGVSLGAKQLVSDITRVRGEFQQLEVAFNTMLGSKEQADTLMSQLVRTAAITPFDLQGVANGAKQLLAYGTAAENVNETLIRLGDIAAGLSIPLNDLVWLYGTTMTQGRLFTQDLRQFQGRGIPLADELAKQFGVAKDKVGELVTAGKIGFPEVQKAIESMTSEGGKFGGLMEAQSKTIIGQISNIEDAIATTFNQIGKENENMINNVLSGASYLVEHWQEVAIAIESAAVAYGTYKAAVMATAALQDAEQTLKADVEIEGLKSLLVVKEESKNADLAAAVASGKLTESKAAELTMLREELALKISSLEAQNALAEKEYANALLNANAAESRLQAAQDAVDGIDDWIARAEDLGNTELANAYRTQLSEKSTELQSAAIARNSAQKALNDATTKKKSASEALNTVTVQANTVTNHANTASMNIMKLAAIQLTGMLKSMWAALMANPLFLVTGAFAGLAFAVYKVATAESEAEKATRLYNETIDEQQKKQDEYKEKTDRLVKAIDDSTKSEGERLQAFEALKAEYPTIFNNLLTEAEYLKEIVKYKKLIAEEDNNRARQSDTEILEEAKRKLKYYQDMRKRGTSTTLVDMDGNGWSTDNVEDAIKAQQEVVNKAIAKVASHDVTSFLGNIKDMKDEDIISIIDGINNSLKALGKSGDDAIAVVTELGGEYSKQQLSSIRNALETEQKARFTEKNTGKEWIEKYKNAYFAAKKELDDFLNTNNALSEIEYERKLKELTDKKDEAEKKYKNVGGTTGNKAASEADKQEKLQKQLSEEFLSLRRQNQQDEINLMREGTEKKLKQIDLDYQKRIDAIRKQEEEWSKAGNGKLTDKQAQKISEAYTNAESMRDKDISDVTEGQLKAEQQALNDYLKEYGTFQQQKLAIAQEYAEKIRKAQEENGVNSAQVKLLEKQRDVAIQNKETEAIKANIDWGTVFGEFGSMFSDMIKPALDEAKKYVRTDKFKNSDQASQKSLIDAISQMEKSLGGTSGVNFKKLGEDVKAYHTAEQNRINAIEIETAALEKLKKSQDDYAKAQKSGTEEEKQVTANALDIARQNADIASANVKTQTDIANQAQRNVTDTATRLKASMENLLGGLQQISSGGLYNAYSGIIKTVNGFKDVIGKTSESLKEVPIVGWILSIIDVLKDGLSDLVGGLLDAVLNAVSGIIGDVLSGDLFVTIGRSLRDGIGNILNAISFGGFNSLFGIGGNAKEVQETIDRLTDRNETLQTAIEDLTDEMKASKGMKSVESYREAVKYQEEVNKNYLQIAKEQAGYHKSHKSWQHYLKWTDEMLEHARKATGMQDFSGTDSLWNLTPEQMKTLRSDVWLWDIMESSGKGGYGERVTDKLDDYIEQTGKLEELTDSLYEGLTGMSFDSMYDSFVSSLMDMEKSAEDVADDISKYFMQAMLSNAIGEQFSDKLRAWYDKFGEAMKDDGTLDNNERKELMDEYMGYVDEAMKLRDELAAATGYDKISQESYSQSSSSRGFGTEMTHEDAGELSGRFTALQITGEETKNAMLSMLATANALSVSVNNNSTTLLEIKNLMVSSNGYLEDIAKYTKDILNKFEVKLDNINKNLEKAI